MIRQRRKPSRTAGARVARDDGAAQRLWRGLLGLAVSALIGACAGGPQISANERYTGQVAAGVVRPAGPSGITVQRRLISALEASGGFAGVYPLFAPTQSSEVGVVIIPSILAEQRGPNGFERLRVQVRAERQSQAGATLDETYTGTASGDNDALDDLIQPLARDLARRFGDKPVY